MTDTPDGVNQDQPNGDHPDGDIAGQSEEDPGWPISFLLLVGAGALYLIFRLFDMIKNLVT
ncbi:MAG: hypothetical protein M5U23_06970 [Acidimicrobiia bacterium]|nr:hypothetical protein [Acidimicrobiia bacterium]